MKQSTRKAIFEFSSIVVAVVLAMGLTEWRQDYLNRKLADQSFDNIIEEITENFQELKIDSARLATDRESMRDWIQKTYKGEETGTLLVGFNFSILSSAALEVARVNQSLTHLSNEKNMELAEIYSLQQFYSQAGSEIFNLMGDFQSNLHKPDSPEFFQIVQKLRYHMGLVLNTVRAYILTCEQFLDKYKQEIDS